MTSHRRPGRRHPGTLTAATADKHWLYEHSVQNVEFECRFIARVFQRHFGRRGPFLREDFCGTANLSCEWIRQGRDHRALGIDLHGPTLDWGRAHHVSRLGAAASRLRLVQDDVCRVSRPRTDIVCATNFSWWVFKRREQLLGYLRNAFASLRPEGLLLMDIYGGPEAQVAQEEERPCDGFTYVWDQASYNPITQDYRCHIHFRFPDGTERRRAFSYDWRLWSVPELRDAMREVGFAETAVYWEGSDRRGRPSGVFRQSEIGDNASAWVAYVAGFRRPGGAAAGR